MLKRVCLCSVLFLNAVAFADPATDALTKGKTFLYAAENGAGNWELVDHVNTKQPQTASPDSANFSGRTALAVYALLSAGDKTVDPRLTRAIAFLKKAQQPSGVYALGFRCLAFGAMPQTPEIKRLIARDAERLLDSSTATGMYTYWAGDKEPVDTSNSQIAALSVSVAEELGAVEVPTRYWRLLDASWRQRQSKDGSWMYSVDNRPRDDLHTPHPGMTAAGIATLLLAHDAMATGTSPSDRPDPNVAAAMSWLGANFDRVFTFNLYGSRTLYTLYMIQRVGIAGGVKRFGDNVWYQQGADYLVTQQSPQGSWETGVDGTNPVVSTAFALLFLSHARSPVAVNKLQYSPVGGDKAGAANWNLHSRDVPRMVHWLQEQTESLSRWQIVSLATPQDLSDAPVLYITGVAAPQFDDNGRAALKKYVEGGGLLVLAGENSSRAFSTAARRLGTDLFPGLQWEALTADHPLLAEEQYRSTRWKRKYPILGLSNGTRELMLLLPDQDCSKHWQAGNTSSSLETLELAADIVQYAGGPGPLTLVPVSTGQPPGTTAQVIHLTRTNEEPMAIPALTAWLQSEKSLALNVKTLDELVDPIDPGVRMVHIAVGDKLKLSDQQLAVLKTYTDAGGTLLLEAAGGIPANADAAEALASRGWPQATAAELPPAMAKDIKLRASASFNPATGRHPITERLANKGRLFISRVDLSGGWAGLRNWTIFGLTIESSREVMADLLVN